MKLERHMKIQAWFGLVARSLGICFLTVGFLKLMALSRVDVVYGTMLSAPNPIFGFWSNRGVLFLAAVTEIWVGVLACLKGPPLGIRAGALLWFACVSLFYQFLLVWVRYDGPCGCSYGLHLLPIPAFVRDGLVAALTPVTIAVCGGGLWHRSWLERRRARLDCTSAAGVPATHQGSRGL